MEAFVAIAGSVTIAVAWGAIRRGAALWSTMAPTLVAIAVAAVLVRAPIAAGRVGLPAALAVGAGTGVALFLATRVFVRLTRSWTSFQDDAGRIYRSTAIVALPVIVAVASLSAVAEELFWRGLVQPLLSAGPGRWWAAAGTWVVSIAANLPSGSLSILLGAAVGGSVWAGLGAWSGGVAASIVCHVLWTVAMIVFPPPGAVQR